MKKSISQNLINTLKEWVELHLGHKIAESRLDDFEKRIHLAAAEAGFNDVNEFISNLIRSRENEDSVGYIALYLTIGETYFFRDPLSYSVLKTSVLPELLAGKRKGEKLSIWSAGCSSGEEPYSLAMTVLSEMKYRKDLHPNIIATDINKQSLAVAKKGIYRRWSFRDIPNFIKDKYFTATEDETFVLKREVRSMVNFFQLNLAEDKYPSILNGTENLDVIFCRNVLIYFSPEQVTSVLAKFHSCLRPGGWLFLAPSEIPHPAPRFFSIENINGAIIMKRREDQSPGDSALISIVRSNHSYFGTTRNDLGLSIDNLIERPKEMDLNFTGINHGTTSNSIEQEIAKDLDPDKIDQQVAELYELGEYKTIIDSAPQIVGVSDPGSVETLGLIARSYANLGNLEAAIDWCDRLIAQDTVNARWYYLKATIHHEKGEDPAALKALKQSTFLDERYIIAHFVMGNLHRQTGDSERSNKCFDHVARLLESRDKSEIVMDSDGLTVGQLSSIVSTLGGRN